MKKVKMSIALIAVAAIAMPIVTGTFIGDYLYTGDVDKTVENMQEYLKNFEKTFE